MTGCSIRSTTEMKVAPPSSRIPSTPSSLRSSPAQNARPAPVMITTPTCGSAPSSCIVRQKPPRSSRLSALSFSGRLSVTVATPSSFVTRTSGWLIGAANLRRPELTQAPHAAQNASRVGVAYGTDARPFGRRKPGSAAGARRDLLGRRRIAVGVAPGLAKLFRDLCSFLSLALGAQASLEPPQRARITGIDSQVLAIDRFRLLRPPNRHQLRAQRFAHRVIPDRRLLVDERVLAPYCVGQLRNRLRRIPLRDGDFAFERGGCNLRHGLGPVACSDGALRGQRGDCGVQFLLLLRRLVELVAGAERKSA